MIIFFLSVLLKERKNILTLIEAYHHYGKQKDLVLVGRATAILKEMKQKISSLRLEDNVKILENIPLESPLIYQGCFCF